MLINCLLFFLMAPAKGSPKPRVVYPLLLGERAYDGRIVIHVHDDLTLYLRKSSVAAPTMQVLTEENGQPVTLFFNGEDINKDLYEYEDKLASIVLTRNESFVYMQGLISPQQRIEPIPISGRLLGDVVPHAVYEIEEKEGLYKTALKREHPAIDGRAYQRWPQAPQNVPAEVTVELFFIVDVPHHSRFSKHQGLLSYLCVMINSVNLRLSAARTPRIKLLVTGVDVTKNETYAELYPHNKEYIYDLGTLKKLARYAYENDHKFGNPDAVYLMTGREVYTVYNGSFKEGQGIGYVSGICTYQKVALGEDKPGLYSGISTLTHELGHVLGAEHDGDGPMTSGHPGALDCPWDDGYVMSYVNKGPSHHYFSRCSLRQIQYVISRAGETCWATTRSGYVVIDQYPGPVVPFVAICKGDAADKDSTIENITVSATTCKLWCLYSRPYQWNTGRGFSITRKHYYHREFEALDYTSCGAAKVCVQGRCIKKESKNPDTRRTGEQKLPTKPGSETNNQE